MLQYWNGIDESKEKVPVKHDCVMPIGVHVPADMHTRSIHLKDLEVFGIEWKLMNLKDNPVFFIYYCTSGADVFGKLMLNKTELIFEPLNESFRGFYRYGNSSSLASNPGEETTNLSFIVNYEDICISETRKTTVIGPAEQECFAKIGLFQTGNAYVHLI